MMEYPVSARVSQGDESRAIRAEGVNPVCPSIENSVRLVCAQWDRLWDDACLS